jgi:hypothetical protein
MKRIISKQELEDAVSQSLTLTDAMVKLKFPENGKSRQKIRILAAEYGVDISKLNALAKNIQRAKYEKIEKTCPVCSTNFITQKNHRDEKYCCSHSCANKFYAKPRTEEEKKKISEGVNLFISSKAGEYGISMLGTSRRRNKKFVCEECKQEFIYHKHKKYCCKECMLKSENYRQSLRSAMLKKVEDGTHSGWKSRKGKKPSYPEQFFMKVLDNNGVQYEHEMPCGRYFIDLALEKQKIALEIDGKQHEYLERKESDAKKDKYLVDNGWKVYRIKWKSINNQSGKIYIKEQIDKLLQFIQV